MLAGAWPEGPEALFVNMMQRYVVPVRRRDWTLSMGDAMEETSEWELTAGCSRRRPRSGDFLCALWVVGIPPCVEQGQAQLCGVVDETRTCESACTAQWS